MQENEVRKIIETYLSQYEKVGSVEQKVIQFHTEIKTTLTQMLESFEKEFSKRIGTDLNQFLLTMQNDMKANNNAMGGRISKDVEEKLALARVSLGKEVETLSMNVMKSKSDEIRTFIQQTLTAFKNTVLSETRLSVEVSHEFLNNRMKEFERILEGTLNVTISKALLALTTSVENTVRNNLATHLTEVLTQICTFNSTLNLLLAEKVIDKQAIEAKMQDIESNLNKQTKAIINFNIDQARAQMEASAKAEIQEGLKVASAQVFAAVH
jgi:hypothetical protein